MLPVLLGPWSIGSDFSIAQNEEPHPSRQHVPASIRDGRQREGGTRTPIGLHMNQDMTAIFRIAVSE